MIEAHSDYCGFGAASVHFDHVGQRVATSAHGSSNESAWKVWDVASGLPSLSASPPNHTCITGELIRVFHPRDHWSCNVIFSHTDSDVLYAVSDDQTVRLSLADGSVTEFSGHQGKHNCFGDAMVLSDDGTVLYVGYYNTRCVVAYDVATLQLMWKVNFESEVCSIAYHNGLLLVAPRNAPVTVLSAEDGSVLRTLCVVDGAAYGIPVFAGLSLHQCH